MEIVGKAYGFGISIDEIDKFNAIKVWNLHDILLKKTKSMHQMSTYSRNNQCNEVLKTDEDN